MTNVGNIFPIGYPTQTGDSKIDGILGYGKWGDANLTYSFPTSGSLYYQTGYKVGGRNDSTGHFDEPSQFSTFNENEKRAVYFALDKDMGGAASAGFAVEGFTNLKVSFDSTADSTSPETFRFGNTRYPGVPEAYSGAHAYQPGWNIAGDVWIDGDYAKNPVAGEVGWRTLHHELGHALGLTHAVEAVGRFPAVPWQYETTFMTVMSGTPYPGASGVGTDSWGDAQTWMMLDIAALQHLYGANYSTNSGNTTYKWYPNSGNTYVNGGVGIQPGVNRIAATIWDGGGNDTYDLSAYSTNLRLDLNPGNGSKFSDAQTAKFTNGGSNNTNIYNALLHKGNPASLIENARGGSGNDTIIGNQVGNALIGNGGNDTLYGNSGNDALYGNSGNDKLYGGAGDDYLQDESGSDYFDGGSGSDTVSYSGVRSQVQVSLFNGGNNQGDRYVSIENVMGSNVADDRIYGNNGANKLWGQGGNDLLVGEGGNDTLYGQAGNDKLYGYTGDDALYGGAGQDELHGWTGNDTLNGESGNDILYGQAGNDRLNGGSGDDKLYGGDGNDYLRDDGGRDYFNGGSGTDTVSYYGHGGGMTVNLATGKNIGGDTYISIENVEGSNTKADNITGSNGANTLWGLGGDDVLKGLNGNDRLYGGDGNDKLYGGAGSNDRLYGGNGNDYLRDDGGADYFDGGSGTDTVSYYGHSGGVTLNLATGRNNGGDRYISIENVEGSNTKADNITGTNGVNILWGLGGDDILKGLNGNDVLYGGDGNDKLYGGAGSHDKLYGGNGNDYLRDDGGSDYFDGGSGADTVSYYGHSGGVTVNLATGSNNGGDRYVSIENVEGSNTKADNITGSNGDNTISGLGGDDRLYGLGGNDFLSGGTGADMIEGGFGQDRLEAGNDTDRDVFIFRSILESTNAAPDRIQSFDSGEDVIDLSAIDANTAVGGGQAFSFSTAGAAANAVWVTDTGRDLVVYGDVNGDARADFSIAVMDINTLLAGDFIL